MCDSRREERAMPRRWRDRIKTLLSARLRALAATKKRRVNLSRQAAQVDDAHPRGAAAEDPPGDPCPVEAWGVRRDGEPDPKRLMVTC